jgi:hypothetical protein
VKLTRVPVYLLLALALVAGGFVFAPTTAAEGCVKDCEPVHTCDKDCGEEEEAGPAVVIVGGTVSSSTTLDISVDGGVGIADGSGGDGNVAAVFDGGVGDGIGDVAAAGNGGTATAAANGGAVSVGNVNSGGNAGNAIVVGDTHAGGGDCKDCEKPAPPKPVCCEKPAPEKPAPPKPAPEKPAPPAKPDAPKAPDAKGGDKVKALPSTGAGLVAGESGANDALLLLATIGAVGAAGYGLRRRFV